MSSSYFPHPLSSEEWAAITGQFPCVEAPSEDFSDLVDEELARIARQSQTFDLSTPHNARAAVHVRRERRERERRRQREVVGLVNRCILPRENNFPEVSSVSVNAEIKVYARDSTVGRKVGGLQSPRSGGGVRGKIKELTRAACRRMKLALRNMRNPLSFITLTYPGDFPVDGKLVKRHLEAFREAWRRKYPESVGLAWILEFQERGAPHFHLWTWRHATPQMREWVSETWYRIVGSGDERHLRAGTSCEKVRKPHAAASYASKYAAKWEQKEVPEEYRDVGRFWGISECETPLGKAGIRNGLVKVFDWTTGPDIFQAIRMLRRLYNARRRKLGLKPVRDNGRYSMTFWGCGCVPDSS